MLEGYFGNTGFTREQKQRLLAVQAALEIAKASAGASCASERSDRVEEDLKYTAQQIDLLANAIQAALNK